jgi:hypothetical protein
MAQVQNLPRGAAAGGAAGGGAGAGAATLVPFAATPAMVNHQDLINYSTKVGTTIYNEGCEKLTTEFDMKSSGTAVNTTELQAKCIKMGWHMGIQQIINFTNNAGSTINIVHQLQGEMEVETPENSGRDGTQSPVKNKQKKSYVETAAAAPPAAKTKNVSTSFDSRIHNISK